jgi:osmotically-inducible protein OsmY
VSREFIDEGRIELRPASPAGDGQLAERIRDRLRRAAWIDSKAVVVTVAGGKVWLEGSVPEARLTWAIREIVASCPGVREIDERLHVAAHDAA